MKYYLSSLHWIDAMTPPIFERIDELISKIEVILGHSAGPNILLEYYSPADGEYKDFMYKIIIPKDIKHELRQYLRMMGITEDYIYPDLEHIAGAIKSSESSRCYMKEL